MSAIAVVLGAAGDWGPDPSATANNACSHGVQVFLGLGDYSYESELEDKAWFDKVACLKTIFYGALGNHDDSASQMYSELFWSTAGRQFANWNYAFAARASSPKIWCTALNTDAPDLDFLEHSLASNTDAEWKIVYFHKPLYTSPGAHAPDEAGIRDRAVPLFDRYHVDIVLAGHNHNYQRSAPLNFGSGDDNPDIVPDGKGTIYIVAGTGGEGGYAMSAQAKYMVKQFSDHHGFVRLTVSEKTLQGQFIANEFAYPVMDTFVIQHP